MRQRFVSILQPAVDQQQPGPTPDECFYALLGMAEYFRVAQPPRHRLSIHYLTVATRLSVAPNLLVLGHFNLGKMLHHHTLNDELAQTHLEQTVSPSANSHRAVVSPVPSNGRLR